MFKLIAAVVAGVVGTACWFHGHAFLHVIHAMLQGF
jgi:hypothetical protein